MNGNCELPISIHQFSNEYENRFTCSMNGWRIPRGYKWEEFAAYLQAARRAHIAIGLKFNYPYRVGIAVDHVLGGRNGYVQTMVL